MVIRVTKEPDGTARLAWVGPAVGGASGAATLARAVGPAHGYGAIQDLAALVVERRLGLSDGMIAALSRGEIASPEADTATRGGPDAVLTRAVAGLLAYEVVTTHRLSVGDFNDAVAERCAALRPGFRAPEILPTTLYELRNDLTALWRHWTTLPAQGSIEITTETGN
jgi:hypothetical protein